MPNENLTEDEETIKWKLMSSSNEELETLRKKASSVIAKNNAYELARRNLSESWLPTTSAKSEQTLTSPHSDKEIEMAHFTALTINEILNNRAKPCIQNRTTLKVLEYSRQP